MPEFDERTGLARGSYGLGTFELAGRAVPAIVRADGGVLDLSSRYIDMHAVLADWASTGPLLRELAGSTAPSVADYTQLRALPPVPHPNLLGTGANYRRHVVEMYEHNRFDVQPGESSEARRARYAALMERRVREGIPFMWTGLVSSMCGANDDVQLTPWGTQHDWELEVCIVIGRSGRHVPPERALELVAGYAIVNDLGTVDTFRRTDPGPFPYDFLGKHQPTYKPIGPFIVPRDEAVPVAEMRIKLSVNGRVMQDALADDMIFGVERLVSYASSRVRLLPGDLIFTGSPPGNGAISGRFLAHGDVIESRITGLGQQRNRCVDEVPYGPLQS
jgi:2,4-didehydro-3-deoxy-L-rhamnonate hydrolase